MYLMQYNGNILILGTTKGQLVKVKKFTEYLRVMDFEMLI